MVSITEHLAESATVLLETLTIAVASLFLNACVHSLFWLKHELLHIMLFVFFTDIQTSTHAVTTALFECVTELNNATSGKNHKAACTNLQK